MRIKYTSSIRIYLLTAALVLSLPVLAEGENYWMTEDRIRLGLGGYFLDIDTQLRLSDDQGRGTLVDLEEDFGLDDSTASLKIEGHYRFSDKHRFIYSFTDISRDGSSVVERDIIFDDKVYTIGSLVTTDFSIRLAKLLYGYSFFQNNKVDISFTAGVVGLELDITVNSPLFDRETNNSFLPLPIVGFRGMYAYNRNLVMKADIDYFKIDESKADAEVVDWSLAIEYNVFKRMDLGLAYGRFDLEGDKKKDSDNFDFVIEGFFVYSKFGFE